MFKPLAFFDQPSQWTRALYQSCVALLVWIIVVGVAFLPGEIVQWLTPVRTHVVSCSLMPDASSVMAIVSRSQHQHQSNQIVHIELDQDHPATRTVVAKMNPECLFVERNGGRLFMGDAEGSFYSVNLNSDRLVADFLGHVARRSPQYLACTPDGKSLAILDKYGLYAWNVAFDEIDPRFPMWSRIDRTITCFALGPDSKKGVCGQTMVGGNRLAEFNLQTGELHSLCENVSDTLRRIVISRDGRFVLGIQDTGQALLLKRDSIDERFEQLSIPELHTGLSWIASFSPDSRVLITSDFFARRLIAWDLSSKGELQRFEETAHHLLGCEFLDSEHILSWGMDDTLRIWQWQSRTPIRELKIGG